MCGEREATRHEERRRSKDTKEEGNHVLVSLANKPEEQEKGIS